MMKVPDRFEKTKKLRLKYSATSDFMLTPASGGASAGVWGRNPSAVKDNVGRKC
jgi:hypothetical protein